MLIIQESEQRHYTAHALILHSDHVGDNVAFMHEAKVSVDTTHIQYVMRVPLTTHCTC